MDGERLTTHPRLNGFEVALWLLGVVLLAAAGGAFWAAASGVFSSISGYGCDSNGVCAQPPSFILQQMTALAAAPLLGSAIVSFALALAVRALSINLAPRVAAPDAGEAPPASAQAAHPQAVWMRDRDDDRIFMRPQD